MNLLLLSNSRNPDSGYLEHARPWLQEALGGCRTIAFVPFAAVRLSFDDYADLVQQGMGDGVEVRSVHRGNPADVVATCDAVAVGGGNTFHLLDHLYRHGLLEAIRSAVAAGKPYVGWSAGSNVACPTMRTTNDMPIVQPPSLDALDLVPYQINPHYLDAHPDHHMGETREERLLEFEQANPGRMVIGLREGSAVRVSGDHVLLGSRTARIFGVAAEPFEMDPGPIAVPA
ncbi:MAG: dipeptidase PepE [Rhodothermales bacterium]|nr:dipeptidase PepE [Rhodothermales bacterium]MBO6778422.1 dipeptidase PepE [Rhodothermales bacterium]